jgi:hypothetical protein
VLAIHYGWLLDDAYVYFKYADNAVFLGHGWVYNPGEYVEGYSSPAWLGLLSLLRLSTLGFWVLIQLLAAASVVAFWLLLVTVNRLLSPAHSVVVNLPLLYLSFNYGVLSYFTSGTESPLVQVLAASYALYILRPGLPAAQCAVAISPLVRHELALPFVACAVWGWCRTRRVPWRMLLLCGSTLGAWMVFRVYYYADLFPNTYYLKDLVDLTQGWRYLDDTLAPYHSYELAVAMILLGVVGRLGGASVHLHLVERGMMVVTAGLVALYVVKIGGDARHYRYLAFPFCLAACSLGGLVESAVRSWSLERWRRVLLVGGATVAVASGSASPRQLDQHPVFMRGKATYADKIADAAHHRRHPRLPRLTPWTSGSHIELLGRYRRDRNEVDTRHDGTSDTAVPVVVDYLCWRFYEEYDSYGLHSLGLTEPILARTEMPAVRPGHKWGLKPLAEDLARVHRWWGRPPARGMYRAAVEAGVARPWIARNLDAIEIIEQKIYNEHRFAENVRLALTFPDPIQPR